MQISAFVVLGAVVAVSLYAVMIYNGLVRLRHGVTKAWANIDVLFKQRHDELPQLVTICKQSMQFEQQTLEQVMKARAAVSAARESGDVEAVGAAENWLRQGLGSLFALAEAYPELKANELFQPLKSRISVLENSIADRREFYNESVNANNLRIEQLPDALVAGLFNFRRAKLLEFAEEEVQDVNLRALFG